MPTCIKSIPPNECCLLNSGDGAWAFEPLAIQLSSALGIDVSTVPRRFNYLLHVEHLDHATASTSFIPVESIRIASDKRLIAAAFIEHGVPIPTTRLLESFDDVQRFISAGAAREWCLKYPTSCGGSGHRLITQFDDEPPNWPRPFVVQEFIRMQCPEVYRTYCAGGELFGWVARRFPIETLPSPWVAHARDARYVQLSEPPAQALLAARRSLEATGLLHSFGCVDLIQRPTGEWLVLEVGTDGLFNHVDRELGIPELENELQERLAAAFWKVAENRYRQPE